MNYDIKFRKKVIKYLEEGHTIRETSKIFDISPNTLSKWAKMQKESKTLEDSPRKSKKSKIDPQKLEECLESHPDAYLSEIAEYFKCSKSLVGYMLKKWGYTRKKR